VFTYIGFLRTDISQRPVFRGGHPAKYWPRLTCLNFQWTNNLDDDPDYDLSHVKWGLFWYVSVLSWTILGRLGLFSKKIERLGLNVLKNVLSWSCLEYYVKSLGLEHEGLVSFISLLNVAVYPNSNLYDLWSTFEPCVNFSTLPYVTTCDAWSELIIPVSVTDN